MQRESRCISAVLMLVSCSQSVSKYTSCCVVFSCCLFWFFGFFGFFLILLVAERIWPLGLFLWEFVQLTPSSKFISEAVVSERDITSLEVEDNLLRLSLRPQRGERMWRPQHVRHTYFESSFAGHSPLAVQKPGDTWSQMRLMAGNVLWIEVQC